MKEVVISFANAHPVRVVVARIEALWSEPDGALYRYVTDSGEPLYWAEWAGTRTHLPDVDAVRDYYARRQMDDIYRHDIEALVDPAAIRDLTAARA